MPLKQLNQSFPLVAFNSTIEVLIEVLVQI